MSQYSVAEAKNNLPKLLDRMLAGEEVTITRRGRPIARLAAITAPIQPQPKVDLAWLRALRESGRTDIEPGDTVREMRDGYRY